MTDRIPLDHLTSDALDALYEQLEASEETESQRQLAVAREALASVTTRAARAESAVDRVRALHHPVGVVAAAEAGIEPDCNVCGPNTWPCPTLAALDETAPAADRTEHAYLSTGCLHNQHDYCSNIDGIAGLKKPAQCKFCAAPCVCPCHTEQPNT